MESLHENQEQLQTKSWEMRCEEIKDAGHRADDEWTPERRCRDCNSSMHRDDDAQCRARTDFCHRCRKMGHVSITCNAVLDNIDKQPSKMPEHLFPSFKQPRVRTRLPTKKSSSKQNIESSSEASAEAVQPSGDLCSEDAVVAMLSQEELDKPIDEDDLNFVDSFFVHK